MKELPSSHWVVRFGAFEVDLRSAEVRKHGFKIRLQDQPFHVLQILLEQPGELVTREELQRQIWPADTFVDFEKGLNNAIKRLRDALGDSPETPQFIETIPRHGYRFIGQVEEHGNGARTPGGPGATITVKPNVVLPTRRNILPTAFALGTILALSALIAGLNLGGSRSHLFGPHAPTGSSSAPAGSSSIIASYPVPLINHALVPETVAPGGPTFTLTVSGTGFVPGSVVNWNGSGRTTTFVNNSQLKANILASDIAKVGTAAVTVVSPRQGGGTSNEVFFSFGGTDYVLNLTRTEFYVGLQPDSAAVGDFNGDGKQDLAVANPGGGTVSILLGKGDGTFQSPVHYAVGQGPYSQVAVGDFNGDGELDLVVSNFASNNVSVLLGNGDGTFRAAANYSVGTNPTSVAVADLKGDGKLDLVVSNQNCSHSGGSCVAGTVSVLIGNGDGTFQAHRDFAAGQVPNWVVVGDFNGDGKLDLAVVNGQGKGGPSALSILLGNGDGTFQTPVSYALNTNGASAATADFNGDGRLDLAVVDNIGLVSIFLGNGDGTFQRRVDYPAGSFPFGSIGIGDFNGDGNLDLAVASFGSNTVTILLGKGNGTFQPQGLRFGTGLSPHGVAVGDFNGNGRLDLAVPARTGNVVSIMLQ